MKKILFALFVSILVLASCNNPNSSKPNGNDDPVVVTPTDPGTDPVVPTDPTVDPVDPDPTDPEDPVVVDPEAPVSTYIPMILGALPTATTQSSGASRTVYVSANDYDRRTVAVRFLAELSSPLVTGWYDTGMAVKDGTVLTYNAVGTTVKVTITIGSDRKVYYDGILGDNQSSLHAVLSGSMFTYRQTVGVNFTDTNPDPTKTEEVVVQSWFTDTFLEGTIGDHMYNASGYEYRYTYNFPPNGPMYRYQYNKIWVKDRPSGFYVLLQTYNGEAKFETDTPLDVTENRIFYYDSMAKAVYDSWNPINEALFTLYTRSPAGDYSENSMDAQSTFDAVF